MAIDGGFDADIARLNRKLDRFALEVKRPTEANRAASIQMYAVTIRNFDKQGADFGRWEPLKGSTIRDKELSLRRKNRIAASFVGPIRQQALVRSGHLRSGFTPDYTDQQARVFNAVEYAKAHQDGVPANNLPARNMLPTRPAVLDIGIKVYTRYVQKQTRQANA